MEQPPRNKRWLQPNKARDAFLRYAYLSPEGESFWPDVKRSNQNELELSEIIVEINDLRGVARLPRLIAEFNTKGTKITKLGDQQAGPNLTSNPMRSPAHNFFCCDRVR
jgi:hypothetical protein